MAVFAYASISAEKMPLSRHLNDYLSFASENNAKSRHAALSLLQGLAVRGGFSAEFPIRQGEHGRPFFDGESAPDFNLSHSGNLAACILGRCRVGIDVQEELDTVHTEKLAARFFGEAEQALLKNAPREVFFALWTKKEALGKCLGEGLVPLLGKDTEALAREHGLRFISKRLFVDGKAYTLAACAAEPIEFIAL